MRLVPSTGALLCLASAVAFGAMAIFGKLALRRGRDRGHPPVRALPDSRRALLGARRRHGRAGAHPHALAPRPRHRARARRHRLQRAGRGLLSALERLDASLLSLLLYTFPAIVTVAAIALGREQASRRTTGALVLASAGLFLVLAGAAAGALDPVGTLLGLTAAGVYSVYILSSEGVAERVGPLILSALVCTGAATTLTLAGAAGGQIHLGDVSAEGFGWLAGIAVVSTVGAVGLFFAGLRRVGPTTASDPLDGRARDHRPAGVPGVR